MNLDQLMQLYDINNYYIWWYGKDIADGYLTDEGFVRESLEVFKGADITNGKIYIVLKGISGYKSVYCFAVRLTEKVGDKRYKWERVHIGLDEYAGRLVLKCRRKFSFYNSSGMDFLVDQILPSNRERTVPKFLDYDSIELSYNQLCEIMENDYSDYYEHLSCVKAVYMIIDGNTGRQYIGSAYGASEPLWARWKSYAETCHGNNMQLEELYKEHGKEYFENFKYIILQIYPMKISDKEIIEEEGRYKKRFLTREFGLNSN